MKLSVPNPQYCHVAFLPEGPSCCSLKSREVSAVIWHRIWPLFRKCILEYTEYSLTSRVHLSDPGKRLNVTCWSGVGCRRQMLSLLLTKAVLMLYSAKDKMGFLLPFYILVHFVCFQICFLNLSPSFNGSFRPLLLQPVLSSQTYSLLPIKSVQI